jgi:hypothetical protein
MLKQQIPPGIEVDHCEAHGAWLDRGELEALLQADAAPALPRARGGRRAAAPPAEEGVGAVLSRAGQRFGNSALSGAGSTLGRKVMGGVLSAVFGKR